MKIGYLHIGTSQKAESGVTRYGRFLAAEARRHSELSVIEADAILSQNRQANQKLLNQVARQLSESDVVHIQYNKYTWGGGRGQLYDLWTFFRHCSAPVVATLHDIYPEIYPNYDFLTALSREREKQQRHQTDFMKRMVRTLSATLNSYLADRLTVVLLSKRGQKIFVSTEEEGRRIEHLVDSRKLTNIPHFVEERSPTISPIEARRVLGLDGYRIVTLQGFIYASKGHQLLVRAIPHLPPDVKVIFAGGSAANNEQFLEEILKLATDLGVSDRLLITGYLSSQALELYLMATHLAICPFKIFSASGSLSTWISLARPILASDLPQIAEYGRLEANAIHTFSPYTSTALAEAIQRLLPMCREDGEDVKVASLREKLSLPKIFDEHLKYYREAARKS